MNPDQITEELIAEIKAKHPGRSLEQVDMTDQGETYSFILAAPSKPEWQKYRKELSEAGSSLLNVEAAIERAALAAIKAPSREECQALFNAKPGLVQNFASELNRMAGAEAEVRAKRL